MVPINTNMHIYIAFFWLRQELKESIYLFANKNTPSSSY